MRAIQLKDFHTGAPAPEADRIRIQTKIDQLETELDAETCETERNALRHRIACLRGDRRMPRG